jgi:hypothetical protein
MEVGQGPNWGCSAKEKNVKNNRPFGITSEGAFKSMKVIITSVPNSMNICQLVETLPEGTLSHEVIHHFWLKDALTANLLLNTETNRFKLLELI